MPPSVIDARLEGLTVPLAPGGTALLTLDRAADAARTSAPGRTETVTEFPEWATAVESWDAGDLGHHGGPRARV